MRLQTDYRKVGENRLTVKSRPLATTTSQPATPTSPLFSITSPPPKPGSPRATLLVRSTNNNLLQAQERTA